MNIIVSPLPEKTLNSCLNASAVLLGAVGGPQWPRPATPENPHPPRPEQDHAFSHVILLRKRSFKREIVKDTEFIVVRELTGGAYFGQRQEENAEGVAYDTIIYSVPEVQRITSYCCSTCLLLTIHHNPIFLSIRLMF
ncbi:hypothetical protein LY90DRAFT_630717 [Neocallimastix californiae]|uniref:Isopropylmalate dehydrogenase-like domain-containing protein n=1 Tax=Neocallimastix californiae TaxID=1754190 RepID=A0A1Y2AMM9_9FUNG|nr:hypothetical protein LY90DRAFT_630717 [Neocallimastix californiae]|eukprot:ORY23828.1 hypothetical protein LY90DRAFT_630717 [Neocallimastix californiae]